MGPHVVEDFVGVGGVAPDMASIATGAIEPSRRGGAGMKDDSPFSGVDVFCAIAHVSISVSFSLGSKGHQGGLGAVSHSAD